MEVSKKGNFDRFLAYKEMRKELLKEFARDFIALGSIPFLVLVIVRVSIRSPFYYIMQFIIGAAIFFVLMSVFKANMHAGLGLMIAFFVSCYYNNKTFTFFAILVYIGMILSLFYLKKGRKEIFKGILFGAISTLLSYYIVKLLVS